MVRDKAEPYFGLMIEMKKKKKTQADLAQLINVNRSTFNQKLNRIDGKDFYYSEAQQIAKELGIHVSDFS
ncbi:helix-turn-helix transcriptional regulator [Limosilactobacillus reuteri]|uniref:Helix-turn-helix transcriptional regulator n=1 Tax=Limosilactobacillus reuteri TaxID=1598 RepID=A0A517D462_LIMRT|nr:helix-turn-helix transcriptional regulator [Limosilactobacillus reuteri]QDR72145.1 helix-turn-helix transcriptional regulator [Limosilactobacillus reuteri]